MKKSIKDSYEKYAEKAGKDVVSKKDYLKLTAAYNQFLMKKVHAGEKVTLPARFGTLQIVGIKQKIRFDEDGNLVGLAPDWPGTKALWERDPQAKKERKRIFHLNAHTNNVRYRFIWSKARVLVENKTLYSLRMSRKNKRTVTEMIEKGVQYVVKN